MNKGYYDVVVVGGGPAGLAAALAARQNGAQKVLILERDTELGGILNQCIHNGFGLHYFKEELTGPEYAARFIDQLSGSGIEVQLDTMVLEISRERQVHTVSRQNGYQILQGGAIVLAMGCRERTRGAIGIPGTRPAGVFTAGTAQRYVNMEGYMVGKRVLILGSGDIGLIMARRMTLEGAKVLACVELMPYSGGLTRNIVQCLDDYDIPLYLSHTIVDIQGEGRVEGAVVAKVDEQRRPIAGTEITFECDTILLSVGLIPENELTRTAGIAIDNATSGPAVYENMETDCPGIFACGNVVHVHDLVDYVTAESQKAGAAAAVFAKAMGEEPSKLTPPFVTEETLPKAALAHLAHENPPKPKTALTTDEISSGAGARLPQVAAENLPETALPLTAGEGIGYTVPQTLRPANIEKTVQIFFRVRRVYQEATIRLECGGAPLASYKRSHLAPGEMQQISLPKVLLQKATGPITISVQEVPA